MDWIGHHNDIAEWGLEPEGAKLARVEAVDWTFPETDIYNTPVHFDIRCQYARGVETSISDRHKQGTKWIGERGWLFVTRSIIEASDPALGRSRFRARRLLCRAVDGSSSEFHRQREKRAARRSLRPRSAGSRSRPDSSAMSRTAWAAHCAGTRLAAQSSTIPRPTRNCAIEYRAHGSCN